LADRKVYFRFKFESMHGFYLLVFKALARWLIPVSLIIEPAREIDIGLLTGICLIILSAKFSLTLSPKWPRFSYF